MRSEWASASSSACEMKTMETPRCFRRRISAKKCRFSSGVSDDVGSSKMMTSRVVFHRAGDLHHLPLGGAECRDRRLRIDGEVQRLQELLGGDVDAAQPVEEALAAEIEVLRHRHRGHQAGLLEHHGDAGLQRLRRRRELHGLAAMEHASRRRLDHAGHDLGQRRLAGAVLAEQRVDLARPQVEVDVLDGGRAVIGLGDLLHLDDRRSRHHRRGREWRCRPWMSTSTRRVALERRW